MNDETTLDLSNLDVATLLEQTVRSDGKVTDTHLKVVEEFLEIDGTLTKAHCYRLPVDKNRRVRYKPLAEYLRDRIIDYSVPRHRVNEAKKRMESSGSTALFVKLESEAKRLFTSLGNTGEGGELLLFAFAEAVFGLSQIICKMSLKTSTEMHYHGADGVYASGTPQGELKVYWGESKLYGDASDAVRDCLNSLAPFLTDEESETSARSQDVFLINEFANFDDTTLVNSLKRYFDQDDEKSLLMEHCGIALVGFDSAVYPASPQLDLIEDIDEAIRSRIPAWTKQIKNRIQKENLEHYEIHFICVPMKSVEDFRSYFLKLMEV